MTLSYTLIADGSSDIALMPIIDWLIGQHRPDLRVVGQFAGNVGQAGQVRAALLLAIVILVVVKPF